MAPAKGEALEWREIHIKSNPSDADWSPLRRQSQVRRTVESEKFTAALKINRTHVIILHENSPRRDTRSQINCVLSARVPLFCLRWDGLTCCFAEQMFAVAFIPLTSTTRSKPSVELWLGDRPECSSTGLAEAAVGCAGVKWAAWLPDVQQETSPQRCREG